MRWIVGVAAAAFALVAIAQDVGQVKSVRGSVEVERGSERLAVQPGMSVRASDVLRTGADGSVGITFLDNTLISAGPSSVLAIERYSFNSTTHAGISTRRSRRARSRWCRARW